MLMTFGKLVCGLWLVRLSMPIPPTRSPRKLRQLFSSSCLHLWGKRKQTAKSVTVPTAGNVDNPSEDAAKPQRLVETNNLIPNKTKTGQEQSTDRIDPITANAQQSRPKRSAPTTPSQSHTFAQAPKKPLSLYPASILGLAMVARGEIGFLISSLAESNGIFAPTDSASDDIYLIVTWAIVLCTAIGPVGVGLLVRRVKRLEREKGGNGGGRDVLGVWGVG
jgi:hypothetical protein